MNNADQEMDKREADHAIKNYTRVPNMLVDGYPELHPQDKWLFVCLVRLCGSNSTRHLSLRFISKKTGFSPSVLSDNKKNNKPGMIGRLHNVGLIHAEIKRKVDSDGEEEKQAQYHITITNTWALNYDFYNKDGKRSEIEQSNEEDSQSVLNQNATVLFQNTNNDNRSESERNCSISERECSDSSTILRLQSNTTDKITEDSKITNNVIDGIADANASTTPQTSLSEKNEEENTTLPTTNQEQQPQNPTSQGNAPRRSVGSRKGKQSKKDEIEQMLMLAEIAAPKKPDPTTQPYNVELFMKLGNYYRGSEYPKSKNPNSRYQKALKSAINIVQRKIPFAQIDKVYCFLLDRGHEIGLPDGLKDQDWIDGGYNTDLWTVEPNFNSKWAECQKLERKLLAANGRTSQPTSNPTPGMDHDEALKLASDIVAQGKSHGYDIQATAASSKTGSWLVRVLWGDDGKLTIKSRQHWQSEFAEIHSTYVAEQQKGVN